MNSGPPQGRSFRPAILPSSRSFCDPGRRNKNQVLRLTVCCFALGCFSLGQLAAQSFGSGDANAQHHEPLQMIVDYPEGAQKRRQSAGETVEPVGLRPGQQVTITLRFLRKRAGDEIRISSLDGGKVDVSLPVTVPDDGNVKFTFRAGTSPGLYRLAVMGVFQYELSFYAMPAHRVPAPWSP